MAHLRISRYFGLALGKLPKGSEAEFVYDDGDTIVTYPVRSIWGVIWRRKIIGVTNTDRVVAGRAALRALGEG